MVGVAARGGVAQRQGEGQSHVAPVKSALFAPGVVAAPFDDCAVGVGEGVDAAQGVLVEVVGGDLIALFSKLKKLGFVFERQAAGSHEIWFNLNTQKYTTIPSHQGDMPEGTLRAILKQADVSVELFLIL